MDLHNNSLPAGNNYFSIDPLSAGGSAAPTDSHVEEFLSVPKELFFQIINDPEAKRLSDATLENKTFTPLQSVKDFKTNAKAKLAAIKERFNHLADFFQGKKLEITSRSAQPSTTLLHEEMTDNERAIDEMAKIVQTWDNNKELKEQYELLTKPASRPPSLRERVSDQLSSLKWNIQDKGKEKLRAIKNQLEKVKTQLEDRIEDEKTRLDKDYLKARLDRKIINIKYSDIVSDIREKASDLKTGVKKHLKEIHETTQNRLSNLSKSAEIHYEQAKKKKSYIVEVLSDRASQIKEKAGEVKDEASQKWASFLSFSKNAINKIKDTDTSAATAKLKSLENKVSVLKKDVHAELQTRFNQMQESIKATVSGTQAKQDRREEYRDLLDLVEAHNINDPHIKVKLIKNGKDITIVKDETFSEVFKIAPKSKEAFLEILKAAQNGNSKDPLLSLELLNKLQSLNWGKSIINDSKSLQTQFQEVSEEVIDQLIRTAQDGKSKDPLPSLELLNKLQSDWGESIINNSKLQTQFQDVSEEVINQLIKTAREGISKDPLLSLDLLNKLQSLDLGKSIINDSKFLLTYFKKVSEEVFDQLIRTAQDGNSKDPLLSLELLNKLQSLNWGKSIINDSKSLQTQFQEVYQEVINQLIDGTDSIFANEFKQITEEEVLSYKSQRDNTHLGRFMLAHDITFIPNIIANLILSKPNPNERANLIEAFITIGHQALEKGKISTAFIFNASLTASSIYRLIKKEQLSVDIQKHFEQLQANFSGLKKVSNEALETKEARVVPLAPFLTPLEKAKTTQSARKNEIQRLNDKIEYVNHHSINPKDIETAIYLLQEQISQTSAKIKKDAPLDTTREIRQLLSKEEAQLQFLKDMLNDVKNLNPQEATSKYLNDKYSRDLIEKQTSFDNGVAEIEKAITPILNLVERANEQQYPVKQDNSQFWYRPREGMLNEKELNKKSEELEPRNK